MSPARFRCAMLLLINEFLFTYILYKSADSLISPDNPTILL